jgi:hypothetical protein
VNFSSFGIAKLPSHAAAKMHSYAITTLLQILSGLKVSGIPVDWLDLRYCFVGTEEDGVNALVWQVRDELKELQHKALQNRNRPAKELGNLSGIARERLVKLRAGGYILDAQNRLVEI